MQPHRMRPNLPWYLEAANHDNNPFLAFKTPAGILAYVWTELPPDVVQGVLDAVVEAGASQRSLVRDAIELEEMGHAELAELVWKVAKAAPENALSISETEFSPQCMETADEVTRLATAAITKMKIRERLEGTPVQDRVN